MMKPKCLGTSVHPISGRANGDGTTTHIEYKCPCGKGKIIEEHDEIVGFKNHRLDFACGKCAQMYQFDISKGVYEWELVKITKKAS